MQSDTDRVDGATDEYTPEERALASQLTSILLVATEPVSLRALARTLDVAQSAVVRARAVTSATLAGTGIRLQQHDDLLQLVTAPENAGVVRRFLGLTAGAKLSRAALETLVIVAYHQPATRGDVERIRGVNSDRVMASLVARGLIDERGQRDAPGRPTEYGTTFAFLELFGLESLQALPRVESPAANAEAPVQLGLRALERLGPDEGQIGGNEQ